MTYRTVLAVGCMLLGCGATDGAAQSAAGAGSDAPAVMVVDASASEGVVAPDPVADAVPQPLEDRAEEPPVAQVGLEIVTLDPAVGALRDQLSMQARKAKADGKRVYLEMSATWCPPCKRMHALLSEPEVVAGLEDVVVIRADTDAFDEELKPLGFTSRTIPAVYELDKRGHPSGRLLRGHTWKTAKSVRAALPTFLRG